MTLNEIRSRSIVSEQGCWIWQGPRRDNGYGRAYHRGRWINAHRLSLMLARGWPEDGEYVEAAHGPCHNRLCCNPVHLNWKTRKENAKDRRRDGTELIGARNGNSKLAEEQVRAIRAEYVRGSKEYGGAALARKYGVSESLVSLIVRRKHRTFI
ncbi:MULTISPECIES: HNH endonuclease [unclassified Caballeronia]|uniref:HNH endonuclease n=1 Tax=unclassified Caballeronia TaxID=2646786 RepID=UPI002028EC67|nr:MULTISPECIES: HNH endonuclease [unclassified Caballeronia]